MVGLIVGVALTLPGGDKLDSPAFFLAITTILWVGALATLFPWTQIDFRWQMVMPLLDMVAIALFRISAPQSGFGILLAFPVIWMASTFGRVGSILAPSFAASLLWGQVVGQQVGWLPASLGAQTPTTATSLSLTMFFLAGVIHTSNRRDASQRVLLRRQTAMVESALDRARVGESTLRQVLDAIEFAVVGLDRQGDVVTYNRATLALLEHLELPEGTPPLRMPLYHSDRTTPVAEYDFPHIRALRGDTVDKEIYWVGHPADTRFAISISTRLLYDELGVVDRVVLAAHDITSETRAIESRDDLVTSMSHELRTPLSSILGYVDLVLEDETLSKQSREMLEIAFSNTQRIMALVADLLSARSTSPSTEIALHPEPCDVADIVRDSIDAVRLLAADRLISMALESPQHVPTVADAFRLRQVVDNLLSNAIKYNEFGGQVQVELSVVDDPTGSMLLRVSDSGRGMTTEEQKGLFERFYRAESVRGTTIHGTGLGLSICRQIVLLHGGEIEVESEPGRGTSVNVRIPQRAALGSVR
ncbi:MAG: two-component sensor histidine kinase [Aeromicrobium sp.]|nr:two-component sensor histidine kinase [Aeromicrobium sp.]